MGDYSIYMILADDLKKRESTMWVYAGRATSKKKALESAYDLLYEEGGGVEAIAVIDWASHDETFVRWIGGEDGNGPEAP